MKSIRKGKLVAITAGLIVAGVIFFGALSWREIAAGYYGAKLGSENQQERINAIASLERLGPRGLPRLFQALKNERRDVWGFAAESIGRIRPLQASTVIKLIGLLNDERECTRAAAALALRTIGPEARGALSKLIEAFSDPDPTVRLEAVDAVGYLDRESFSSFSDLVKKLKDESPQVRVEAAFVLVVFARSGKNIGPAIPSLVENLADSNGQVQSASTGAIKAAGLSAISAIPSLKTLVKGANKSAAAHALSILGAIALNENIGLFTEALKDSDPNVAGVAIECLLTVAGKPVLDSLLEAFKSGSVQFRIDMLGWLRSSSSPHAIPIFLEALKDSDPKNRIMAADSLGNRGPAAKEAIPALEAAANDPDDEVKNSVKVALEEIRGVVPK